MEEDRKAILLNHLGFIQRAYRECCPFHDHCVDNLLERTLTAHSKRLSSVSLPHAVNCRRFCFRRRQSVVFGLCMKYRRNHWMDLCQIHTEKMFGPSLFQV